MAKRRPLRVDPIAEAKRQWSMHGWDAAADGMAVVTSVMRAHQLLLARVESELKPLELSFARFELLRLLAFTRGGSMPLSKVVSRLQVHPASVTSAVDRLVRAGLVVREPHPEDGRAVMLTLTVEGSAVVERATLALNARVFTELGLPEGDARALVGILARMRRSAGDFDGPRDEPAPPESLERG